MVKKENEAIQSIIAITENQILSVEDEAVLISLSESRYTQVRLEIADGLCGCELSPNLIKLLFRLAQDKNSLVRVCAYDALSTCGNANIMDALFGLYEAESVRLVKRYIVCSMIGICCDIGYQREKLCQFLERCMQTERNHGIRITCVYGLYALLGSEEYLSQLISAFCDDNYRNRCYAVNLCMLQIRADHQETVAAELESQLKREDTEAVASTIRSALAEIENQRYETKTTKSSDA